ncbi:MAG: phosphatase PAP2 family protein [Lachnospiraceae bacterium]|nr:phosphatase PAP2 family protein [Lachnospiraceae bacterium]
MKTKERGKKLLFLGKVCVLSFVLWTILIQKVDVQPCGVNGTDIGLATINLWFHRLTGVHKKLYSITDWLGLIPICICMMFAGIGLRQWIKRRNLRKVDLDIVLLGIYYIIVISGYLLFERIPINYRPILLEGVLEVSYPSSTTLLVLCVMMSFVEQMNRSLKNIAMKQMTEAITICFSVFMVVGRMLSGVHWFTDIIGSIILSTGLFLVYKGTVLLCCGKEK